MDYPLEELGPERFQQLCQALLLKDYPRLQCLPVAQPDGGRDGFTYLPDGAQSKFMVFQVKFARKPMAETEPHKWLMAILEDELPKIQRLIPRGASRFCLLTNISGTSHLDAGSIDKVNKQLEQKIGIPSDCWWRDDINRRLDGAWDLKWSYPEVMRGPDLLRAIIEGGLSEHRERREGALRAFLRTQYSLDEEVRFKQVELQNKLLELFIDVPLSFRDPQAERNHQHLFRRILSRSNRQGETEFDELEMEARVSTGGQIRWHASKDEQAGAATILLSSAMQSEMPHVVVEGAPGQGKSTISQYICQVHRMRLLREADALRSISAEHASSPIRLPIKVDLRDFATWLAKRDPFNTDEANAPLNWIKSLESFLAALISHQSGGTHFTVDDLLAVFRISAMLLVFDGLDEVADLTRRRDVVEELTKAISRLADNSASLQVIVTSRPAAFANSPGMPHRKFPHLQLVSLTKPLIMEYANRWLQARHLDSKQTAEFRYILKEKLDQPHLRDLARNPMQLAILLSLIHTKGTSLPDKRTALYDDYVALFFSREAAKSTIVRDHRDLLIDIHRYLAWLLHSEAEQGNSRASISLERLQRILSAYLSKEGHNPNLTDQLFTGIMERVVAIVSRVEGTVEFEVQPLREYFAACHLYYTSPQSTQGKERSGSKPDRFDVICRNFYWLNVTRFYAGCYSKGEIPSLVDGLEELISEDGFRYIDYPRSLATTLLGDFVFNQVPKSITKISAVAFDADGLRYLLAPHWMRRARLAPNAISLPPQCGKEELVSRCFALLKQNVPRDFTIQLIDVIKNNCEIDTLLIEPWLEHLYAVSGEQQLDWLDVGTKLEILPKLPLEELEDLIAKLELASERVALPTLFRAGRTDYFERSEHAFNQAIDGILDRSVSAQPQRRIESALHALSHSVDLFRYSLSFRDRQPTALSDVIESRHSIAKLTWPDRLTTLSEPYQTHHSCVALARIAEGESTRSTLEWATDLAPWEAIVEGGRLLFGERWAFLTLANLAAGIRSNTETCSSTPDLLDGKVSLTRRVRYARLRAGSERWWAKQFSSAVSQADTELCLLVIMTWGRASLLVTLEQVLAPALEQLSTTVWHRLFYAARSCRRMARADSSRNEPVDYSSLPGKLKERLAIILCDRADPETGHRIFRRFLKNSSLGDPIIREFANREAMNLTKLGTAEWKPDLALIEECYVRGESVSFPPFGPFLRHEVVLPIQVARKIAAAPRRFPSFLVASAEEIIRSEVMRKIRPVAEIAQEQRWFADQ